MRSRGLNTGINMTILSPRLRAAARRLMLVALPLAAMLAATAYPGAALADVAIRVEARPADGPIEAFVRVTDAGAPVEGLAADDFTVLIDGQIVPIGGLTLPPDQDGTQKVSVVFAMDYSGSVTEVALEAMQNAVIDFAETMSDGDFVALVKFNDTNPARASVVLPFTEIDHGVNNAAIAAKVVEEYPGDGTNILDAVEVAVNLFAAPALPLPAGPKAIVILSDGAENRSEVTQSEVVELANANGIPVFAIGVGDLSVPGSTELLTFLGDETGGQFIPTATEQEIADAYASISLLLTSEYLVTIPNGITDCAPHTLEVQVAGQAAPATAVFTRRTCDSEPNPFNFGSVTGVNTSRTVTSDPVTITGLEVPAHISVIQGRYSIGCTATTTEQPGTIEDGDTVCVSHQTSAEFSTSKTSTLTIGGIAGTFTSTTRAEDASGGGGGGGGATGLLELLLGLGVFLLARRRLA